MGTCQHYLSRSNLCNSIYKSTDYIFTNTTQSLLSSELDDRILPVLGGHDGECGDLISKVLCHYFFAPCGENGLLHLPLSLCPEECHFVESVCGNQMGTVNELLDNAGLSTVNCTATKVLIQDLSPCCIDAGIEITSEQHYSVLICF